MDIQNDVWFYVFLIAGLVAMVPLAIVLSRAENPSSKNVAARDGLNGLLKIYHRKRDTFTVGYSVPMLFISTAFLFRSLPFIFKLVWFASWLPFPSIYLVKRLLGANYGKEAAKLVIGDRRNALDLISKLDGEIRRGEAILRSPRYIGYDLFPSAIVVSDGNVFFGGRPCIIVPTDSIASISCFSKAERGVKAHNIHLCDGHEKVLCVVGVFSHDDAEALMSELNGRFGVKKL